MIGFYSAKAAEQTGTTIYTKDGQKFEVTGVYVTQEAGEARYLWDDKVCLGEVGHFLAIGRPNPNRTEGEI